MPDLHLLAGESNPNDVRLTDPTLESVPLAATTTFAVLAVVAALTVTANLAAVSELRVSTNANVTVGGPLLAQSTIAISTNAALTTPPVLAAVSSFAVASTGTITLQADLQAASSWAFASAPPLLRVGGISLSASPVCAFATTATLSRLAAALAASPSLAIATTANVVVVGPTATSVIVAFNGTPTSTVRIQSITIDDVINEAPNTCDFIVNGTPPAVGTDVKIGLQNLLAENLLFGGTVRSVDEHYDLKRTNRAWAVSCVDYSFLLNRRKVFGAWKGVSATTVAQAVLTYTSGFSAVGIVGGLPAITVTFDGVDPMSALTEIAGLIGGYTYVDYSKVVHLFVTETGILPDPLDGLHRSLQNEPPVRYVTDLSPVRTRVYVKGASATVRGPSETAIAAGSAQVPVDDADPFPPGGQVITDDAQILTYTGVYEGGTESVVAGNVVVPTFSGSAALAAGAGHLSGVYRYKVAFGNGGGETAPGVESNTITAPEFAAPSSTVGLGATNAVGPLVGSYSYKTAFVTGLGETLPSVATSRTAVVVPAPPSAPTVGNAPAPGNLVVGSSYKYLCTYVTAFGETAPTGTATDYVPSALSQPGWTSPQSVSFGGLSTGPYLYGVSLVTALGESAPIATASVGGGFFTSAPSGAVGWSGAQDTTGRIAPGSTYVWACSAYSDVYGETPLGVQFSLPVGGTLNLRLLMNIPPLPPDADGLRVYRGLAGGNPFMLNAEFRRGSVPVQYWDALSQGECGSQFPVQTLRAGVGMRLLILASGEAGVVARRIYRSKAGGTEMFFVGELQNNFNTTFTDYALDAQLAARNPVVQTTGRQARLTNIPISSRVGVIGRRIYRTKANGSTYFLVADLKDNTTTTVDDNIPDASLSFSSLSMTSTAGGDQHLLSSIPIGPTGTLARKVYRTVAGGSEYKLLGQLSDNTTTTFLDTVADDALGGSVELVNTAGASSVLLSSIPIGPTGVTQRILYRTAGVGSDFKYLATLNDNTTTTYLDDKADSALGRLPLEASTIGALKGDTSIQLKIPGGSFAPAGWVEAGGQIIRYTGYVGFALVGIPSTGDGSITGSIAGGSTVTALSMITGVDGLIRPLKTGSQVSLWITCNSPAGQAVLAAAEGGDGVHEHIVTDSSLDSIAACTARGNAELALFQYARVTVAYTTLDPKTRSGKLIHVALPAPQNLAGDFMITNVRISDIDVAAKTAPRYAVTASNTKFSLNDLLRHVVLDL